MAKKPVSIHAIFSKCHCSFLPVSLCLFYALAFCLHKQRDNWKNKRIHFYLPMNFHSLWFFSCSKHLNRFLVSNFCAAFRLSDMVELVHSNRNAESFLWDWRNEKKRNLPIVKLIENNNALANTNNCYEAIKRYKSRDKGTFTKRETIVENF